MYDVGEDRGLFQMSSCAGYYISTDDYKHYLTKYGLYNDFEERILDCVVVKDGKFKKEFDSGRFCPICLIEKPHKTRHVRKVNLCVREFHFYSHLFDKIVFYKNAKVYALVCALHILFLLAEIIALVGAYAGSFSFHPFFYIVEFFVSDIPVFVKLMTALNTFILGSWVIDAVTLLTATFYGLTIDELLNPQHYPYLFKRNEHGSEYNNPADAGALRNFAALLSR